MIGMLHRGEADFAVAKFVMSPARLQAVDFISTLEKVKYEAFCRISESRIDERNFRKFHPNCLSYFSAKD
jgi:hypothetical protein